MHKWLDAALLFALAVTVLFFLHACAKFLAELLKELIRCGVLRS